MTPLDRKRIQYSTQERQTALFSTELLGSVQVLSDDSMDGAPFKHWSSAPLPTHPDHSIEDNLFTLDTPRQLPTYEVHESLLPSGPTTQLQLAYR